MPVTAGPRQVRVWNHHDWVTVQPTEDATRYRVIPEQGDEFIVRAETDEQCTDRIAAELRRRNPQGA